MFSKVLIGVDGGQGGRDAIALAKQLADPRASIALAHVYGAGLMPGRGAALLLAAELEESEEMLERERRAAAPDAHVISCPSHSIGRGLDLLAARDGFDLIVIGASRHGLAGRVLLGNDAIAALEGAPCAVAVAPVGYAHRGGSLSRMGVGFDGRPEANAALAAGRHLAAREGSTLKALLVLPLQSRPYGETTRRRWWDVAREVPEDDRHRFEDLRDVEIEVCYGRPGDELERCSEALDLLIVGSRDRGVLRRILAGSTSSHLVRHVRCPLLVVRGAGLAGTADAVGRVRAKSTTRG